MDFHQAQSYSAVWQEAMAVTPRISTVAFCITSLTLSDLECHSDSLPPVKDL